MVTVFFSWDQWLQCVQRGDKVPRYYVIGDPIQHSLSPVMQQAAFDYHQQAETYAALHITSDLMSCLQQLRQAGVRGVNITIPYKEQVLSYCDELSASAQQAGAVNTIHFKQDKIYGHNTDGFGFQRAINQHTGKSLAAMKVMILGAGGGAGKAIASACINAGCPQLYLINRSIDKLAHWQKHSEWQKTVFIHQPSAITEELCQQVDLIVNATSLGLNKSDILPIDPIYLQAHHIIYDTIYNPYPTQLLQLAKPKVTKVLNGLSMLVAQGALSYQTWLQYMPNLDVMMNACLNKLNE